MGIITKQTPGLQDNINDIRNSPNSNLMANFWKKLIKKSYGGQDVGQFGMLNPIKDEFATQSNADERQINESPELADQPMLRKRLGMLAKARDLQGEGSALGGGLADLQKQWTDAQQRGQAHFEDNALQGNIAAGNIANQGTHFEQQQSLFDKLLGGITSVGASAATKI